MNNTMRFMELFGDIDNELIFQAGQPWSRKRVHAKVFPKRVACAILIVLLGISCIFHTEVKAALDRFTTIIGQILGIQEDISSYTQIINKPLAKNGMTITLREVILDKDEITVSYSVETENSKYKNALLWDDIWIDGQKVVSQKSFKADDVHDSAKRNYVTCYRFGDEISIDETVDVKILFRPADFRNEQLIGEYEFAFQASKSELDKDTINFSLEQEIPINDGKSIRIKEFTGNSLESSIIGEIEELPQGTDYYLKGTDNLGNPVEYRMLSYIAPEIVFVKYTGEISAEASSLELQVYVHYGRDVKMIDSKDEGDITLEDTSEDRPYETEAFGEKFTIQIKGK